MMHRKHLVLSRCLINVHSFASIDKSGITVHQLLVSLTCWPRHANNFLELPFSSYHHLP